jgi:polysaccharide export outer membrane protein
MTRVLLALMLMTAAPQAMPQQQAAAKQTPPASLGAPSDYEVGPQDKLNISVLGIPEFGAQVVVDNEGKISYIGLGRIPVAGKTLRQIQDDVRQLLIKSGQHTDPTVTVDVAEYRSQMVYVSGAVTHPQGYPVKGSETLMNILAQAGFAANAGRKIQVSRNKPVHQDLTFDRQALENGTAPPFQLKDGDAIFVPEAEKAYVRGEVKSPGLFEVTPDTTVLQLIVMAGDFTDRAARGSIKITRNDANGKPGKPFKVNREDYGTTHVQPGDIIEVGRRFM